MDEELSYIKRIGTYDQLDVPSHINLTDCIICLESIQNGSTLYHIDCTCSKMILVHDNCANRWFNHRPNNLRCPLCANHFHGMVIDYHSENDIESGSREDRASSVVFLDDMLVYGNTSGLSNNDRRLVESRIVIGPMQTPSERRRAARRIRNSIYSDNNNYACCGYVCTGILVIFVFCLFFSL